jgi:hypothetical protein
MHVKVHIDLAAPRSQKFPQWTYHSPIVALRRVQSICQQRAPCGVQRFDMKVASVNQAGLLFMIG